ncbi:MAG: hypothetical protein HRT45_07870 [Bdellovibrionales bacterium]|nr:hypothetical protein [Bdellovibrionales bacterium]
MAQKFRRIRRRQNIAIGAASVITIAGAGIFIYGAGVTYGFIAAAGVDTFSKALAVVATGVVAAPTVTVGGVTIILSSEALHPASLRQLRKTFFQHVEADDTTPMVFEMKIYDRFVRKYSDYLTAVN